MEEFQAMLTYFMNVMGWQIGGVHLRGLASHPTAVCVSVCLNELANIKTAHKQVQCHRISFIGYRIFKSE